MQVTETVSEGLKRGYTVVVPGEQLESRRQARLGELSRGLTLPGFRPGKIPASVVRQRYGKQVLAEVLQESVREATEQMVSERGLRPATPPKVDVVAGGVEQAAGADLEFKVELEVLPEISIPDFSGIKLTRLKAEPSAAAVDEALERIANSSATLAPVEEEHGARKGEVLQIDFAGTIDGAPFAGSSGSKVNVEVGGAGLVPGFAEQLEGMAVGETREVTVQFPADHPTPELAGKEARFTVTAGALFRRVIPPADDELAKKTGYEGLDALKDAIRRQIQREYDSVSRLRIKRALFDELAGLVDFAPPQSLAGPEFEAIWGRVEAERQAGRGEPEDAGKDAEALRSEYRAIAERRVRLALLLAEVGRVNGIGVTEEELAQARRAEAGRYPGQEAQVLEFYRRNPRAAEGLRGPILEEKVIDFILEMAQVTDEVVSVEELLKEPDSTDSPAEVNSEAPLAP